MTGRQLCPGAYQSRAPLESVARAVCPSASGRSTSVSAGCVYLLEFLGPFTASEGWVEPAQYPAGFHIFSAGQARPPAGQPRS